MLIPVGATAMERRDEDEDTKAYGRRFDPAGIQLLRVLHVVRFEGRILDFMVPGRIIIARI